MGIISAYAGSVVVWSVINAAASVIFTEKARENGWVEGERDTSLKNTLVWAVKIILIGCVPLLRALLPICFVYMAVKKKEES